MLARTSSALISSLLLGTGCLLMSGCQKNREPYIPSAISIEQQINRMEARIKAVERKVEVSVQDPAQKHLRVPSGPIKSITFRIGTTDDRLRIYWANGSKSDMPCTKEQSIWACG